jgi:pilus assembly protein CpaE
LAVGSAADPKLVLRTLREGAQDYLDQDDLPAELAAALARLRAEAHPTRSTARTLALAAAAGGCGCSTLAVNIAAAYAKAAGSCILLDLHAEAGDLAPLLDLKPVYTLADLCRSASRLDRGLVEGAFVSHESGIRLLAAPARVAEAAYVTADAVRRVLSLSSELRMNVVADLGRCFRPEAVEAAKLADELVLVLRLDFTSLRNARRLLEHLREAGHDPSRVRIVVNRHRQPGELAPSDAESALGVKIASFIIDDPKTVNRANNNGLPVLSHSPSAKVSAQIAALAESLKTASQG